MPKFRNFQTNFSGGLLSEGMLGRLDLAQYENGCKQLVNWWPKVTGGMRRRPGTTFLYDYSIWHPTRIEPFIFNEDQTYLVAFIPVTEGSTEIRIHNPLTGAQVAAFHWVYLTETIIKEMSITQKADVMFIAHKDLQTIQITRTGATTFTIDYYKFENHNSADKPKLCPFANFATLGYTLEANGHTGTVTLTVRDESGTEVNYFVDGHVGARITYRGKQMKIASIGTAPSSTCTATVIEELDRGATLGIASIANPQDFIVGEIIVGRDSGIKAEVVITTGFGITVAMISGIFPSGTHEQIEGLDSGNIAAITTKIDVPPPASADWAEEAFTDLHGYPSVVEFHSQRLWFGGSSSLPAHIFGSRVAAFFNFDTGDAFPADSIHVTIAAKQLNQITDIVSGRHLQVFTDVGVPYAAFFQGV